MRVCTSIEPKSFIVADRVDDQRVAFPMADVMPVVTGSQILWMFPPIHVNDPVGVWATDVKDEDTLQFL